MHGAAISLQATLVFLDYFATLVMTKAKMATRHTCGVVEAISLQVANRSPHCVRDDNPEIVIAMERSD